MKVYIVSLDSDEDWAIEGVYDSLEKACRSVMEAHPQEERDGWDWRVRGEGAGKWWLTFSHHEGGFMFDREIAEHEVR